MMHWGLKWAVRLAVALYLVHAVFTQFYETGYGRIVSPAMCIGLAVLLLAFLRRRPWSWSWVFTFVIVAMVINLAFLPQQKHFGEVLALARVLVGLEVLTCAVILAYMLHPTTKAQFHAISSS